MMLIENIIFSSERFENYHRRRRRLRPRPPKKETCVNTKQQLFSQLTIYRKYQKIGNVL